MKQILFALMLIMGIYPVSSLSAQSRPELDTVFVKRSIGENQFKIDTLFISGGRSTTQVLAGTTFLPYSNKMIELLNTGLSPISLEIVQECDNTIDPKTFKNYPRFMDVSRTGNTLTIDVSVIANCCHNFLGEAVRGRLSNLKTR